MALDAASLRTAGPPGVEADDAQQTWVDARSVRELLGGYAGAQRVDHSREEAGLGGDVVVAGRHGIQHGLERAVVRCVR